MEIKKNMKFVCIKDVLMEDDGEVNYVKGDVYTSEQDGAITNMLGEKGHLWSNGEEFKQHFIPYYQLDKIYTKHTSLLEKIFDKYEDKKHKVSNEEIVWYCNCDAKDETGWFWGDGRGSDIENYYQENGFTYLSEKAFIEFMDLGKYVGSLNVESEGFNKKELEIVSEVIDKCIYGEEVSTKRDSRQVEEVPDYLNIAEEWSKHEDSQPECGEDMVNNPSHYQLKSGIQVIDIIEGAGLGFHLANVIKYVLRAGKKDPSKELEDLKKAEYYLHRKINQLIEEDM